MTSSPGHTNLPHEPPETHDGPGLEQLTLDDHLAHFRRRVLTDALTEATALYWLDRAATFETARPQPDDYNGAAIPQQLQQRDYDLAQVALACRRHAQLLRDIGLDTDATAALEQAS